MSIQVFSMLIAQSGAKSVVPRWRHPGIFLNGHFEAEKESNQWQVGNLQEPPKIKVNA
jgi:hypothetical protein